MFIRPSQSLFIHFTLVYAAFVFIFNCNLCITNITMCVHGQYHCTFPIHQIQLCLEGHRWHWQHSVSTAFCHYAAYSTACWLILSLRFWFSSSETWSYFILVQLTESFVSEYRKEDLVKAACCLIAMSNYSFIA